MAKSPEKFDFLGVKHAFRCNLLQKAGKRISAAIVDAVV